MQKQLPLSLYAEDITSPSRLPKRIEAEGFRVLKHRRVSTNDEGLSLGQLMIANAKLEDKIYVSCSTT